ncbi:MAG: ATPase domain-containing protein [Candidatus Bathyarchaeia archaeon]|jgi:KaiC/GvpD/RAD55 family RecA-like ATPase
MPLIEDLTKGPVPPGSSILVEFNPASQWHNASVTVAAGWLRTGGGVSYVAFSRPPDDVRSQLRQLELDVEELERTDRLWITDAYSASMGQKSKERFAVESLKVADLSIYIGREAMADSPAPEFLTIADNISVLDRFNAERNWIEMYLTRPIPMSKVRQITNLNGIIEGIHSDWAYKQLEAAVDGIINFKLDETTDSAQNLIRIRNMRNIGFDGRWHRLKTGENFEVTLEK